MTTGSWSAVLACVSIKRVYVYKCVCVCVKPRLYARMQMQLLLAIAYVAPFYDVEYNLNTVTLGKLYTMYTMLVIISSRGIFPSRYTFFCKRFINNETEREREGEGY